MLEIARIRAKRCDFNPVGKPYAMHRQINRHGFTLTEVIIASGLFAIVATISVGAFCGAFRDSKGCCSQINFTATARIAQQRITKYIENGHNASVISNGVNVYDITLINYWRIAYVDADNNPNTEGNNQLIYYPDGTTTQNSLVLCSRVSPIDNTTNVSTIFSIVSTTPSSVGIAFHLGDRTNATDAVNGSVSGMGYQGINVQFTATPRNLLRTYQF